MLDKTTKLKGGRQHPGDEDLLSLLDGELDPRQAEVVRSHLEACWICRARTEKFQSTINSFVEYRHLVLTSSLKRPETKNNFQAKLREAQSQQEPTKSFIGKWLETFNTFLKFSHPAYVRFGVPLMAVIVVIALLVNQSAIRTVSAGELLKNTDKAQKATLNNISNPVVYQKIQVRRSKNNAPAESVNWETWEDTNKNNFRDAIEKQGIRQLIVDNFVNQPIKVPHILENERPIVLTELAQTLRFNNLNSKNPLSAVSLNKWSESLSQKKEEVTKIVADNGNQSFELKITPLGNIDNGKIIQASYYVRADDWTPFKLRIEVNDNDQTIIFELTKQNSEVIARHELSPEIFPTSEITDIPVQPTQAASPTQSPSPLEEVKVLTPEANSNANVSANISTANNIENDSAPVDLEVDILARLNQVNGLTGEQLSLERTKDNKLLVKGVVDSVQRKNEILQALQPIANNKAVKIQIKTIGEVQAEQRRNRPSNISIQDLEVKDDRIPIDDELQKYFRARGISGDQIERQIQRFSIEILGSSRQSRSKAFALKQIAGRFSVEDLEKMDAATQTRWRNLIAIQARSVRVELQSLKQKLGGLFPTGSLDSRTVEIRSNSDTLRLAKELFDLVIKTDDGFRRSFTLSNSENVTVPVRSPEFWQTLSRAEKIAAELAGFR